MVDLLACTIMPYAWGSHTAIAELMGRPSPSPGPEAELWMGAHPVAPSRLSRRSSDAHDTSARRPLLDPSPDGATPSVSLADVITADAPRELGGPSLAAFGARLPFLLKVLAAAEPLSLQAHPNAEQARAGFADEDARGIPRDAPTRSYRDASHKPELLCALTPVDALCGFRRAADSLRLFAELAVAELDAVLAPLRARPDREGLAATFGAVMGLEQDEGARIVRAVVAACQRLDAAASGASEEFAKERAWAVKLDALYPGDVGVVSALLLNLVHLEPGEALYLDAGNLHAYLSGVGVEIMASSDNVLRGGLTKKHVDVPELLRVLDFEDGPVHPLKARAIDAHERVWETPSREFRLSLIEIASAGTAVTREVGGPEILLCTSGSVVIAPGDGSPERQLGRGGAAFVPGNTGRYTLRPAAGADSDASVYRATVNLT